MSEKKRKPTPDTTYPIAFGVLLELPEQAQVHVCHINADGKRGPWQRVELRVSEEL